MKTVKNIFKSLINNQVCVDEGRNGKSWVAIILGLVSVVFSVLPITISAAKINGDNFVSSSTYNSDVYLTRFTEYLQDEGITLTVTSEGKDHYLVSNGETAFIYKHKDVNENVDFTVYVDTEIKDVNVFNDQTKYYDSLKKSFMYLSGKYMFCALYSNDSDIGSTGGDYVKVNAGTELSSFANVYSDGVLIARDADPTKYRQYVSGTFSNWKKLFRESYETTKVKSVWQQTGLFAGIYAALIVLLGFTIWLMCRGKTNPFRIYSIWNCQKISYWAALCPSLIGLILGLLLPNAAMMGFIMCFGIRLMWLSMNNLRPQNTYAAQPEPKKK